MTVRVGITGHQTIETRLEQRDAPQSEQNAWKWVESVFRDVLASTETADLIVISSLAEGTDQRLSRIALQLGAQLLVIVPSDHYGETFDAAPDRAAFQKLLEQAQDVIRLDYATPSEDAFSAAGKRMVELSDWLVAVWDGEEAEGFGGTGDIVDYARDLGKPVIHIDPIELRVTRYKA